MSRRLVVVDTNVFVSALMTKGVCRTILQSWLTADVIEVAMCPYLFDELSRVINRPKIRRFVSKDLSDALLGALAVGAAWHPDPRRISRRTRDTGDDPVVQFAYDVGAELLISGDQDLATLEVARVVRVADPARALHIMHEWHS
jgi:putative PIN family toxin of toxin-antitoxin system